VRRSGRAARALALTLALVGGALASGRTARAEDADPWFGHDKVLHFEATSALAVVGYAGASFQTDDRPTRATAGLALALGAGVGKELWDLTGHGDPSWRDLTWDVVGAASGVLVALAVDWIAGRAMSRSAAGGGAAP
jgi:putative lipoprotein